MKKLVAMTFAAMTLVGCGSICDDVLDASDIYAQKVSPCRSASRPVPEAFNVTQCERAVDRCTDSEQDAINAYADCLRDLPECTPGTDKAFDNALEGCRLTLEGKVGDNCRSAL
jgi:hypothetical protein